MTVDGSIKMDSQQQDSPVSGHPMLLRVLRSEDPTALCQSVASWSSAIKQGFMTFFFNLPRKKTRRSFQKNTWFVLPTLASLSWFWVLNPTTNWDTKGDGCWQDETCEDSHWGAETGCHVPYWSPTSPNSRKTEAVQCHQPPYHQQCEVFSPGVGGKVAGCWWRFHQEVIASIFQTWYWYVNFLKLSVRGRFLDLIKFRFTTPVLPEVRIFEMLLGRPQLPVNAHRDLVQRVKVLARSRPSRKIKLNVHVV